MYTHKKMSLELVAVYTECFGTPDDEERFYREDFWKTLRTYARSVEPDGRIKIAATLPPDSIPLTDMRDSLRAAAKMPYIHRGGRPHAIPEDEIGGFWQDVIGLVSGGEKLRRAIRTIAYREAVDPRTLKSEFRRAGYLDASPDGPGKG